MYKKLKHKLREDRQNKRNKINDMFLRERDANPT